MMFQANASGGDDHFNGLQSGGQLREVRLRKQSNVALPSQNVKKGKKSKNGETEQLSLLSIS